MSRWSKEYANLCQRLFITPTWQLSIAISSVSHKKSITFARQILLAKPQYFFFSEYANIIFLNKEAISAKKISEKFDLQVV